MRKYGRSYGECELDDERWRWRLELPLAPHGSHRSAVRTYRSRRSASAGRAAGTPGRRCWRGAGRRPHCWKETVTSPVGSVVWLKTVPATSATEPPDRTRYELPGSRKVTTRWTVAPTTVSTAMDVLVPARGDLAQDQRGLGVKFDLGAVEERHQRLRLGLRGHLIPASRAGHSKRARRCCRPSSRRRRCHASR